MSSGVYSIKNILNKKVYIGKTKNLLERKNAHFNCLKLNKHNNPHLQNAYNKYGKENFVFEILELCNEEFLSERELYYIQSYKDNNYNIIQAIDNRQNFPQEMKDKMKQSKISKGLSVSIYSFNIITEQIVKWDSIKECSKSLNLDRRVIQNILKNKKYSYKGYTFSFNTIFQTLKSTKIPVFVYDINNNFIGEFDSILKCARTLKTSSPYISKYINTGIIYNKRYFYSIKLPLQ